MPSGSQATLDQTPKQNGRARSLATASNGRHDPELVAPDDPKAAAKTAGLVYATDRGPGITRRRAGKGWRYLAADSTTIKDQIDSADVNDYLRQISGQEFTAKDFRTWAGTVLAAQALRELAAVDSEAEAKQNIVRAIEEVAARLGNTRAVCRKCYVHPEVLDGYLDGTLVDTMRQKIDAELS